MSIEAMSWAFKQKMKPMHKFVLVTICDCVDSSGELMPSISNLAEKTSLSEQKVSLAIDWLDKAGFLDEMRKISSGMRR